MSEQIVQRIMEHFQNEHGGKLLQIVLQDGLRKMVTEMVEAEVTEFLGGRGYYERRGPESEVEGYRNGYRDRKFQTGSGVVNIPVPRVRNTSEPFNSAVLDKLGTRTDQLEKLVTEMYARGLSRSNKNCPSMSFGSILNRVSHREGQYRQREVTGLVPVHEGYLFRSPAGEPIMIGLSALSAFFVLALFRWKKWGSGGSFW